MQKKYSKLIILSVVIFLATVAIRYWPIYHKGFSSFFDTTNLILARNLSLTGEDKMIDKTGVVLSSGLVKEYGLSQSSSNRLTPIIYSWIFSAIGFNTKIPLYVSLILYGITNVLLFFLVLRLFNIGTALLFTGIDIFSPFVLSAAAWFGYYEWAMLFFIIGISIYLWKEKPNGWRLLLSGLFFGLAALARDAFLISFVPLVIYDFYSNFIYKKEWRRAKQWLLPAIKRIFMFALPIILLWGGFMYRDYLSDRINTYINKAEVSWDGHLFTDPYTYRFEKEKFIEEKLKTAQGDEINGLIGYGYTHSLKARIKTHLISIKYYITGFVRQPLMGGSLIVFFLLLGIIFLYKRDKKFFVLPVLWIIFLFLTLIGLRTSNETHFLEIRFPLILLISLGVFWALDWLKQVIQNRKIYILLTGAVLLVLFTHLIQSDKWRFHEDYLYSRIEEKVNLLNAIKKSTINIGTDDTIAVSEDPQFLNYYTDYNYIYFNPETIEKLLNENKLQWAFDQFRVTYVAGFGELLNGKILDATNVRVIDLEITDFN